MTFFLRFVELLCEVLTLIILLRSLMSWITPGQTNLFTQVLFQITEPILGPIRRIMPKFGMVDFSPVVAIVILQIIIIIVNAVQARGGGV